MGARLDGAGAGQGVAVARLRPRPLARPDSLVGNSAALVHLWERAARYADLRQPVLIRGELGVGKLAVAEALAVAGGRRGGLVTFDAALERVEGVNPWMRRLLDTIQSGAGRPVQSGAGRASQSGAGRSPATVVVRHVELLDEIAGAALAALLDQGFVVVATTTTRPGVAPAGELVDRFSAVVEVPPLRHRIVDIRPLALDALHGLPQGRGRSITEEALAALEAADWPGNVRELRTTVRRAAEARAYGDVSVLDLPERCGGDLGGAIGLAERAERSLIRAVLDAHDGRRGEAAMELGISRSTLYRRLRAYGLDDRGT